MLTTTPDYILPFLLSLLTTVTAQTLLKLSVPDYYGTATIRFKQHELIKFYNCLCHSRTKRCSVFANSRDYVNSQYQIEGIEVSFFQYECSKLPKRNDFKCLRLYAQTDSCRNGEYCLTFYISPNETECNFAGSIGIAWTNPIVEYDYYKEIVSVTKCINGCNGYVITTPSPGALTSPQTDETQTFVKTSTPRVNISEPDSMSNLTAGTPKSRQDQDDNQTKLISGVVVGVFLFVIVIAIIVGFIIFKKRTISTPHETYCKYQTSTIMVPSTPDNNGLRSSHRANSGQNKTANTVALQSPLNTAYNADVSNPINNSGASDTYANDCYTEDNTDLKDSTDLPPFEQVEYYNINGQVKINQQSSAINNDSVEYLNTCCNSKENDPSCYEDVPDGDLGNLKYNVQISRTNHTKVDGVESKSDKSNSKDANKTEGNDDMKPHVYTAVKKLKENSAQDYSTLNATVRNVNNPYNLLLDPIEYETTTQKGSGAVNGQRAMYFDLEEGKDCDPDGEDRISSLPDQCIDTDEENIYEEDPQAQGTDNVYSQIDA